MRVSVALSALFVPTSALAVGGAAAAPALVFVPAPAHSDKADQAAIDKLLVQCPPITAHVADQPLVYHGEGLAPQNLTELPPATAYMAVLRHIDGCNAPLTMVETAIRLDADRKRRA
jgi:hypothetical protein